jgi:hypothetical protein
MVRIYTMCFSTSLLYGDGGVYVCALLVLMAADSLE